jgi:hypothetical protein
MEKTYKGGHFAVGQALVHKNSKGNVKSNKTKRPYVLATVMLAMFMAAIEATIVATAMPAIGGIFFI